MLEYSEKVLPNHRATSSNSRRQKNLRNVPY